MKHLRFFLITLITTVILILTGCTDDYRTTTSPHYRLNFSEDTISFDTVFTSIATPTSQLKLYNRHKFGLRFDAYLAGGDKSPFKINIDGNSGHSFHDMEIRNNDSLYCFVSANLNKLNHASPQPVCDSIIFMLESGTQQQVILMAYGQDVIIYKGKTIISDTILSTYMTAWL